MDATVGCFICGGKIVAKGKCSKCYIKKWRENNPEYGKKYRLKNKKRIQEAQKEYRNRHRGYFREKQKCYRENHPEKIKESKKKHYQKNKETIKQKRKLYYKKNVEKVKETNKKWCERNPDKVKEKRKKTKNKRRGKGYLLLWANPFPKEIEVDNHHIIPTRGLCIPIPKTTHRYKEGFNLKEHIDFNNYWIEKIYCMNIDMFLNLQMKRDD